MMTVKPSTNSPPETHNYLFHYTDGFSINQVVLGDVLEILTYSRQESEGEN